MIKAFLRSKNEGTADCLFLGLSFENLDRLREGQPILIEGEAARAAGFPVNVVIHADVDEQRILNDFVKHGITVRSFEDPGDIE